MFFEINFLIFKKKRLLGVPFDVLKLVCYVYINFSEAASLYIAQVDLGFNIQSKLASNSWSLCFILLSSGIIGVNQHSQ